jgi:hypothetical protein
VHPLKTLEQTIEIKANVEQLIHSAHEVLVHYLPGTPLPSELSKVRAMLDAHMFGRDKRTQRDDIVRVARQIDSWRASRPDETALAPRLPKKK